MSSSEFAIVTGAGSGIGRAVAESLLRAGWGVTLVGREAEKLEAVAQGHTAKQFLTVPADIGAPGRAGHVVEEVLQKWGRVDLLVNNAARAPLASISETDHGLLAAVFETNLFAPFCLVSHLWPAFYRQGGGCVVNISSMVAPSSPPALSVYSASKAGLEALTRSILNEGREASIRAYTVAPGAVDTPLLRDLVSQGMEMPKNPLEPQQVADVVMACARGEHPADGQVIEVC